MNECTHCESKLIDNELVELLQLIESDLYHICKFNIDAKSKSLLKLKEYMRKHNIEEKD